MHRDICQNYKRGAKDTKADGINLFMLVIKAKRTENDSTWDFNVETIFVVD